MIDFEAEKKAIELLMRENQEADLSKDIDRIMNLFTEDIIYHLPNSPPIHGKKALRALLEQVMDDMEDLSLTSEKTEIAGSGDIGFNVGSFKMKSIGEDYVDYKYFVGVRKTSEGWKIAVDTFSRNR
jgi:ketosteroid isomerase-like protein